MPNHKRPTHILGYRMGDIVETPRGMKARIIRCRADGKVDAKYLGIDWRKGPETTLDPRFCKKVIDYAP